MAMYTWQPFKFYAGYEHISFGNPQTPLGAGFDDIGGYKLAFVNNAAFPQNKILQVYWGGVKYAVNPQVDFTAAWYGYKQNSYGIGASLNCNSNAFGTCSGTTDDYSYDFVWKMSKRFSSYAGMMYTGVHGGQANGYVFHTNDLTTTFGLRYIF